MGAQPRELVLHGVVLHVTNAGEAHRLVEMLTHELGRVTLLAPGARASRRRFGGRLDLFASLRLQARRGRQDGWVLHNIDSAQLRLALRGDLARLGAASRLTEWVQVLTPVQQAAPEMLAALEAGLDALAAGELTQAAPIGVELLRYAGVMSDFTQCDRCGQMGEADIGALDLTSGAALCERCSHHAAAKILAPAVVAVLKGGSCADAQVAQQVESCLMDMVELHAGRALRTRHSWWPAPA